MSKSLIDSAIREAFSVLCKYPIYYHGYFIYGNIGETEEEMLYTSQFAKEIKLDSITFQKLRIEKFSPLREIAENTPGYHVTDKGELYSDTYSHATLKKIGRKIKFSFYTPMRLIKIVIKVVKVRLFTLSEVISFLNATPRILYRVLEREMQKKRLGNSIKRIFMKNS